MQIYYKEYFRIGDIEKLAAFDMYWFRWILSTKVDRASPSQATLGRGSSNTTYTVLPLSASQLGQL